MIKWVAFQDTERVSPQIQGNGSALKGAGNTGIIGKSKEFEEAKPKISDAACCESLAKTLFHWQWGPLDHIQEKELKDPERIL